MKVVQQWRALTQTPYICHTVISNLLYHFWRHPVWCAYHSVPLCHCVLCRQTHHGALTINPVQYTCHLYQWFTCSMETAWTLNSISACCMETAWTLYNIPACCMETVWILCSIPACCMETLHYSCLLYGDSALFLPAVWILCTIPACCMDTLCYLWCPFPHNPSCSMDTLHYFSLLYWYSVLSLVPHSLSLQPVVLILYTIPAILYSLVLCILSAASFSHTPTSCMDTPYNLWHHTLSHSCILCIPCTISCAPLPHNLFWCIDALCYQCCLFVQSNPCPLCGYSLSAVLPHQNQPVWHDLRCWGGCCRPWCLDGSSVESGGTQDPSVCSIGLWQFLAPLTVNGKNKQKTPVEVRTKSEP